MDVDPPELNQTDLGVDDLTVSHIIPQSKSDKSKKNKSNDVIIAMLKKRGEERVDFAKCMEKILQPEEKEDEIDLFFKTMAATVKKFTPMEKTEAKMNIFKIVSDIEIRRQLPPVNTLGTFNYAAISPNTSADSCSTPINSRQDVYTPVQMSNESSRDNVDYY